MPDEIVIDAKSGMTGAGRAAKEEMLFSEVSEGFHAYGVGHHRHMAELDQEFSTAAGREVVVTFTPHLVPMNRGILSTIYVRGTRGQSAEDLHAILLKYYAKEPFVHVLPFGQTPQTRHVRGSNMTFIGVAKDRVPGPRDRDLGARQSGEGRVGPGGAEHEPDARLSRDDWASSRSRCFRDARGRRRGRRRIASHHPENRQHQDHLRDKAAGERQRAQHRNAGGIDHDVDASRHQKNSAQANAVERCGC